MLVTRRELEDLIRTAPPLDAFDRVVAENGALLFTPEPPTERPLARPPPTELVAALRDRGVEPIAVGRIIVATSKPFGPTVKEVIAELGLALEVVYNRGAVMVLPAGVSKASGLAAALADLGVAPAEVAAVGDAENDHAMLAASGVGVAVANAVPALKQRAQVVTTAERGDGVVELCEQILATGLEDVEAATPLALWSVAT